MLRTFLALTALFILAHPVSAQNVGDTAAAVEAELGRPPMVRTTSQGEMWIYSDGVRVTFKGGVVAAVEGKDSDRVVYSSSQNVSVVPEAERPAARDTGTSRAGPSVLTEGRDEPPPWVWTSVGALALVIIVCKLLILIRAFSSSVFWGLGSLLVPFVSLIFVICHWSEVKRPFLISLSASMSIFAVLFLGEMSSAFALH